MKKHALIEQATEALNYIHNVYSGRKVAPVLHPELMYNLERKYPRLLKELRERTSNIRIGYKSFASASAGNICMNCNFRLADQRGNCSSLCATCIENGMKPKEFKLLKSKQTCQRKYNVDNPFQCADIKQKIKGTVLEKYGDTNVGGRNSSMYESIKKKLKETGSQRGLSRKATFQAKYGEGITHWTQIPSLVKKSKAKLRALHGVDNVMHIEEIRNRHLSKMQELKRSGKSKEICEKAAATCQKKYGVPNYFQLKEEVRKARLRKTGVEYPLQDRKAMKKFRETCQKRYGGTHPMHSPEVATKALQGNRKIYWYEVTAEDKTFKVIGSGEVFLLKYLLNRVQADCIQVGLERSPIRLEGLSRRYYPDFYVGKSTVLEAKSTYTLFGCKKHNWSNWKLNCKKARSLSEQGLPVTWLVVDPGRGSIVRLTDEWWLLSRTSAQKRVRAALRTSIVETISPDQVEVRRLGATD